MSATTQQGEFFTSAESTATSFLQPSFSLAGAATLTYGYIISMLIDEISSNYEKLECSELFLLIYDLLPYDARCRYSLVQVLVFARDLSYCMTSSGVSMSSRVSALKYDTPCLLKVFTVSSRTLEFPHDEILNTSGIYFLIPISQ